MARHVLTMIVPLILSAPFSALATEAPTCPAAPTECISLAEAVDRGFVTIVASHNVSVVITNHGPYPVCLDAMYVFTAPGTQDAMGGLEYGMTEVELAPGESVTLAYGPQPNGAMEFWCSEETHPFKVGPIYDFNGAQMPPPLYDLVLLYSPNGSKVQTLIWDYFSGNPVYSLPACPAIAIGRSQNYLELGEGESSPVTIEVDNMGFAPGAADVSETVPAGFTATGFSVVPSSATVHADGSVTFTFTDISVPAAVVTGTGEVDYGFAGITYTLTNVAGECPGRTEGAAPTATWTDCYGETYTSEGSPMTLDCCETEGTPALSGEGYTPGFWKTNFQKAAQGKTSGRQLTDAQLDALMAQVNDFFLTVEEHGAGAPFLLTEYIDAYHIMQPEDSSDPAQKLARNLLASELNYFYGATLDDVAGHLDVLQEAELMLWQSHLYTKDEILAMSDFLDKMNNL